MKKVFVPPRESHILAHYASGKERSFLQNAPAQKFS